MAQKITASPDFIIRPLKTDAEMKMFHHLAVTTFLPDDNPDETAYRMRKLVEEAPDFIAEQQRGAFLGDTLIGGYLLMERLLYVGSAQLPTGCIADVMTLTEHRQQGIATALLHDALQYANTHNLALLLLDGIPNFYHRFGFTDVLDISKQSIELAHVQAFTQSSYHMRACTLQDAPALLALYQRHYATRTGSFVRTPARQEHLLRWRFQEPPLLVVNTDNIPCGYIKLIARANRLFAYEVAADNWHAALALLQHHATIQAQLYPQEHTLCWSLPIDAPTVDILAEHLPLQSQITHAPDADWMARPADLPTLLHAMLPQWNMRQPHIATIWSGNIELVIGDEAYFLTIDDNGVRLQSQAILPLQRVHFSPQVFTKLLFGYRSVTWAKQQARQHLPAELLPLFEQFFPRGYAWINGSDAF